MKKIPKIILVIFMLLLVSLTTYWIYLINMTPSWWVLWWWNVNFINVLKKVKTQSCWVNDFIRWFDSNWNQLCWSKTTFSTESLWTVWSAINYGSWKYSKYLWNVLVSCWPGRYFKWFDLVTKQMICSDRSWVEIKVWRNLTTISEMWITFPQTKPVWWYNWWRIQSDYYEKVFQECWVWKYAIWYNSTTWIICWNIIKGKCWSANSSTAVTSYPTSWLCDTWSYSIDDNSWTDWSFNWKCSWDLWTDESCSVPKIINWWWSSWSSWSSCSATCWWWTQSRSRSCSSPSPQNWWAYCSWNSWETQSCNTHSCCTVSIVGTTECTPNSAWDCWWWSSVDVPNTWRLSSWTKTTDDASCVLTSAWWCIKYVFRENSCFPSNLIWETVCTLKTYPLWIWCWNGSPWSPSTWKMIWWSNAWRAVCAYNSPYWCTHYKYYSY